MSSLEQAVSPSQVQYNALKIDHPKDKETNLELVFFPDKRHPRRAVGHQHEEGRVRLSVLHR